MLPQELQEIANTLESSFDSSSPEQISSFLSQFEEKTKKLTREERLKIRNDIMLRDRFLGKSNKYIADKFRLSDRQIQKIFKKLDEESDAWYIELPKKLMSSIHKYNSERVFAELQNLIDLRNNTKSEEIKLHATTAIIDNYMKFDKMVADGPTVKRQKEIVEQAEKIINENGFTSN